MSLETKRLEAAVAMSRRKTGPFAKRPKTVRFSARELLEQGLDDDIHPAEILLIEAEARGEFDDE